MPKISRDLDFIMTCLGEVLREQGEDAIAARLPWLAEAGVPMNGDCPERLPQAYSTAFTLLNMIEENAYAQNHRQLAAAGQLGERSGSWENTFRKLLAAGHQPAEIAAALPNVRIEPVLTAHPTQAKRRTILEHHRELYLLLVQRENQMWTPGEQADIREQIKAVLERLWRSGEIHLERPDVASEVRNVLHYLRNVFPSVLPLLARRLREAWRDAGLGTALLADRYPFLPQLQFGSWVGGDRDGHPFVTGEITGETLMQLRALALDLIRDHLTRLGAHLSLSDRLQAPSATLSKRLGVLGAGLGKSDREMVAPPRNPDEPWRQFVNAMLAALSEASAPARDNRPRYGRAAELLGDLAILRADLLPHRRRPPRGGDAAGEAALGHRLAGQDHGQAQHRRAPPAPGRAGEARRARQGSRLPRLHPADHARRERRAAHPRQGQCQVRVRGAGLRGGHARDLSGCAGTAERHPARHRTHRQRQDDYALHLAPAAQYAGQENPDRRGPDRVSAGRRQPDSGQAEDRPDLRQRAPLDPAPGSGHHHDRRDPRPRDGADRRPVGAHRPLGAVDPAHQLRRGHHHPAARHGARGLPAGLDGQRHHRPAAGPQALPALSDHRAGHRGADQGASPRALCPARGADPALQPAGCELCNGTGYHGRSAIAEMLVIDEDIRRMTLRKADARDIQRQAVEAGMRTLYDDGMRKALAGLTSIEEVLRVTREA